MAVSNDGYTRRATGLKTTVKGDVIQFRLGLSPESFGELADALQAMSKELTDTATCSLVAQAVAQEVAEEANEIIVAAGADDQYDGNRVYGARVRHIRGAKFTTVLYAPRKDRLVGANYSDAYYIEYGYGAKGYHSPLSKKALADNPRTTYSPQPITPKTAFHNEPARPSRGRTQPREVAVNYKRFTEGWYYNNEYKGRALYYSQGSGGLAPLYRAKLAVKKDLADKTSTLHRKLTKKVRDALAKPKW